MSEWNCDECKYYSWYYDKCTKWDCKVDFREAHNCYEPMEKPIRDIMAGIRRALPKPQKEVSE